jgi:hypothetical protein
MVNWKAGFLYPDVFSAFSYSSLAWLNIVSFEEFYNNLWQIDSGNCLRIWGGWFEDVYMY